jgi:hypothetical protein
MVQEIIKFLKFRDEVKALMQSRSMAQLTNQYLQQNHADLLNQLEKWHKKFNPGQAFKTGCSSCFFDHFIILSYLSINQIVEKMNLLHKIKEDRVVQFEGQFYSAKSPHLTNEICEKLFNRFGPELFEKYDHDWRSKVITVADVEREITKESLTDFFEIVPEVENNLSALSYKELQQLYKEKTGKSPVKLSKAKLIEELS